MVYCKPTIVFDDEAMLFFFRVFLLCLCASYVSAQEIAITNAGFEDLYQGQDVLTGSFPVGAPPSGWQRYDLNGASVPGSLVGVLNPGTQADYDADGAGLSPCFPGGAPQGDNAALVFKSGPASADEYGIQQSLTEVLQAGVYTLSVEVGNIQTCAGLPPGFRSTFNLDGFPGYRIELRAGNQLIAMDNNSLTPPEGQFQTSNIVVDIQNNHPQLGQNLSIRLVNLSVATGGGHLEVDFDDVRLNFSNAVSVNDEDVPLPGAFLYLLAGIFLLLGSGAKNYLKKTGY